MPNLAEVVCWYSEDEHFDPNGKPTLAEVECVRRL